MWAGLVECPADVGEVRVIIEWSVGLNVMERMVEYRGDDYGEVFITGEH